MKWYHFSVEYFEDLRNINHCEFLIMRKSNDSGKYILETNLRTWSQLKQERLAAARDKEKKSPAASSPTTDRDREKRKKLEAAALAQSQMSTRKKWGGCPDGCDHGKHTYKRENSMHAMEQLGRASPVAVSPIDARPPARRRRWQNSSDDEDSDVDGRPVMAIDVPKSLTDAVSSPDGTPSFISMEQRLRKARPKSDIMLVNAGRDFGGSASGNTSVAGSDTEGEGRRGGEEKEEELRKVVVRAEWESGMGRGAMADALGDQSDVGSDTVGERDVDAAIGALQLDEGSVQGSVY